MLFTGTITFNFENHQKHSVQANCNVSQWHSRRYIYLPLC